jgi:ABC-2 type transport system permease protein
MPIFDQGYQHWQGQLSGHAWRWLTVTRNGVKAQLKNRWTRLAVLGAWAPALALAAVLIVWGLLEQQSDVILPLMSLLRLPPELMEGPKAFRTTIWTLSYYYFFQVELFFTMLLVLLVGPNLISQDLRFNAIPLYFSRPLRRFDYFLGKLGVIGAYLLAVTVFPALIAYVLGVGFSLDLSVVRDTGRLVVAGVAYGLLIVVSAGTLMLALSSLSRNSRYVSGFWLGAWIVTGVLAQVVEVIHTQSATMAAVERMRAEGRNFPPPPPPPSVGPGQPPRFPPPSRERLAVMRPRGDAVRTARVEALQSDYSPLLSFVGNLRRVGAALLNTDAAWDQIGKLMPPVQRETVIGEMKGPQSPWYWSAGILAGLLGLSVWILTSRVKSLDRLK